MVKKTLALFKKYTTSQLIVAFIVFWTPVIIFAKLAGEILERDPIGLDSSILYWIHSMSTPFLDTFFLVVTTIGNVEYILPITVLLMAYLVYRKQKRNALMLLFGMGGAAAGNVILKLIFQRNRPTFWDSVITETSYSFPSGHAMLSCTLVLCLIVMLWNTRWRIASLIVGGLLVLLIGLSRLYLGVHYPTDIVAGWSVSLVWVLVVTVIVKSYWTNHRISKSSTDVH